MKLTDLNIKRINVNDVDDSYCGQDILFKMGELYQYESGIYGFENLWVKLQRNIENIIIDELDKVGCVQTQFPILQPRSIWNSSNRWVKYVNEDNIMFTSSTQKNEYALAPTAEECAILFASERLKACKTLPTIYYQIGEKFRKEMRPRGYLFRPRTFMMMDAYSFDANDKTMGDSYERMKQAYINIFEILNLKVVPIAADNGSMGGKKSEEWMAFTKLGEDVILYDEKTNIGVNTELLERENYQQYLIEEYGIKNIEAMKKYKALELGHNFQLGTRYSDSMKLYFSDDKSNANPYFMGCYGLGNGRVVAVIIENSILKDKNGKVKGLSLPTNVAPYLVHIVYKEKDCQKEELANSLYSKLESTTIHAIIDNRQDISMGVRIKDAFILGSPYIAIIGDKTSKDMIEIENTKTDEKQILSVEQAVMFFKQLL